MAARGREVLRGNLLHRKKGSSSWKKRRVIVYCGVKMEGKSVSASVLLFEEYEKVEKMGQKPKKVIDLCGAKIEESGITSPVGSANTISASPSSGSLSAAQCHQFLVILTSEANEFRADTDNTKLHWVKLLTLLTMFPYSVIPEEPKSNPISEGFRVKLDPRSFNADSAWAVYIMPEDVGHRCNMIGIHILLLRGGVAHQSVGHLDIISPADPNKPIVTWDRDKMRRTGKTGNLVFIEIGRRCTGGEGLVWMYCGFDEATAMRETLHRFLFEGNGQAVSIPTYGTLRGPIYDHPRSSFDSSLPGAYNKEQSVSGGYQYHQVQSGSGSGRFREDSGYPGSPVTNSMSPAADLPPPLRLDKHPSFRKQHSLPCRVPKRAGSVCSSSPSGSLDRDASSQVFAHSVNSLNEEDLFDERGSSRQSVSPPDVQDEGYSENEESGSGQFVMDPDFSENGIAVAHQRRFTEPMAPGGQRVHIPQRSNTAPSAMREYEKMVHPNAPMYQEGYVVMVRSNCGTMQKQQVQVPSHYDVPSSLRRAPAADAASSSSPRKYENCHPLPTIQEANSTPQRRRETENYENYPINATEGEEFVDYEPNYENIKVINDIRRVSRNSKCYENTSINKDGDRLAKRASLRRDRSIDKEEVQLPHNGSGTLVIGNTPKTPSPPKNCSHFPYGELQSSLNHTNPSATHVNQRTNGRRGRDEVTMV